MNLVSVRLGLGKVVSMDNMEELWGKLQLTEEDEVDIEITKEEVEVVRKKGALCLIGKLWMDRVINKGVIEAAMDKIWRLSAMAVFKEVGHNVFTISFANTADKTRVETGRPWLFDNNLFVLLEFDGLTPPKSMCFDRASLWLQLHQLPR